LSSDICFRWRKLVLSPNGPKVWRRATAATKRRREKPARIVADKDARFCLAALANYMNPDGTSAYPSIARIAADTGLSTRAVKSAMTRAADGGWIARTRTWVYEYGKKMGFRYSYEPRFPDFEHGEPGSPRNRPADQVAEESAW
jgi:hypothetical protein